MVTSTGLYRRPAGLPRTDSGGRDQLRQNPAGTSGRPADSRLSGLLWDRLQQILAAMLLLAFLPLLGLIWVFVRGTSKGGFLYAQRRPGLAGRTFRAWKIRTMYEGADRDPKLARGVQASDPQVTAVGRILRRLKIDEIPQLWNVVRGEMSFVGPRPIAVSLHNELCAEIPGFASRLLVKPGLTSLGQICIDENAAPQSVVEDWRVRFEAEQHYLMRRSVRYDLVIIGLTVLYLLRKIVGGDRSTSDR